MREQGPDQKEQLYRPMTLFYALIPLGVLIILLGISVYLYGDETENGASQMALLTSSAVAMALGRIKGYKWRDMENAMAEGIGHVVNALLILLMVGALIGSWLLSGTVPTMIYYGLQIIHPDYFYVTACLLCAVTSVSIGSSWSTAGTLGVGLVAIAAGLGLSVEITAGAIISGAYFGDKMSPLSDTTNLASAVTGVDLFSHIRHMTWTTGPAIMMAFMLYLILGLSGEESRSALMVSHQLDLLEDNFNPGWYLLLPIAVVFFLAFKKIPTFATLMIGTMVGGIWAILFQQSTILTFLAADTIQPLLLFDGVWRVIFGGFVVNTGDVTLDGLLSRGGMGSMLNTVWLIICAVSFGAILEKLGMLACIVRSALYFVQSRGSMILTGALTCIGVNIVTADQYIAILLPGRMYQLEFTKRKLALENLSRLLEDAGTMTSVLVPWNTCGAFMAGTLGVMTFSYLPYCFFNLFCPVISVAYGYMNFKITPAGSEKAPHYT